MRDQAGTWGISISTQLPLLEQSPTPVLAGYNIGALITITPAHFLGGGSMQEEVNQEDPVMVAQPATLLMKQTTAHFVQEQ